MSLCVEFYGIARQRAGVSQLNVELPAGAARLIDVLDVLAQRLPAFGQECLVGGGLHPILVANVGGERFVAEPSTLLYDGQSLLILSADAGG